jgi:hypothetical protein
MGQHRWFPGSFWIMAALLTIPSIFYAFVSAAENADECEEIVRAPSRQPTPSDLRCEQEIAHGLSSADASRAVG